MPGSFKRKRFPGCWSFVLPFLLATSLAASVMARPAAAKSGYAVPLSTMLTAAAYGNGIYVVAGTSSTGNGPSAIGSFVVLTSTDGTNWTAAQPLNDMNIWNIYAIAYGNGAFAAVGRMPGKVHDNGVVLTSSDGAHWSANTFDIAFYQVAYGNGRFVLLGDDSNYTSKNGVNWTPVPNRAPFIDPDAQLIFVNGVFTDIDGDNGTTFATSPDGVNWQTQDMGLINYGSYPAPTMNYPNIGVTGVAYGEHLLAGLMTISGTDFSRSRYLHVRSGA